MIRRFLSAVAFAMIATFAAITPARAVDVNTADEAQLQTIKGVGPAISARIVAERKKGDFKDWSDFQSRVNGIGDKTSVSLSQNGLTVGGAAKANAPAKAVAAAPSPAPVVAAPKATASAMTRPATTAAVATSPVAPVAKKPDAPAPMKPVAPVAAPVVAKSDATPIDAKASAKAAKKADAAAHAATNAAADAKTAK